MKNQIHTPLELLVHLLHQSLIVRIDRGRPIAKLGPEIGYTKRLAPELLEQHRGRGALQLGCGSMRFHNLFLGTALYTKLIGRSSIEGRLVEPSVYRGGELPFIRSCDTWLVLHNVKLRCSNRGIDG